MELEHLIQGCLPLTRGSLLCIDDGQEMLVHVRNGDGRVWITQQGDRRDVALEAGESFRIERGGRTLIYAVHGSLIALTSPYAKHPAQRIEMVRPGNAQPMPVFQAERGWRGMIAALGARLMKTWVGLYARPPRRIASPL